MTNNPTPTTRNRLIDDETLHVEASVVGSCILFPARLRDCDLGVQDFAGWQHRIVWGAMRDLEAKGVPIDTVSLELAISQADKLDALGGVAAIGAMALDGVSAAESFDHHVREVADRSLRRRVALAAEDVMHLGVNAACTGEELLETATTRFGALDSQHANAATEPQTIGEIVSRRYEEVGRVAEEQANGGAALTGAPTGIAELDRKIGGWRFKIANMIAARPGMGKSALGLSTADACTLTGLGVHVFSLEDSIETYGDRALARGSGVPAIRLRQADLRSGDMGACVEAIAGYSHTRRAPWIVDDRPSLSAAEIVRAWRRRADKNRTRVVIVDYVQLLRSPDPRLDEHRSLGLSLQALIDAARVDNIALVVMSQFNRQLESRADKRPQLSDLRGSGELEEKIKLCVALYRGSYYGGRPIRGVDYDCACAESVKSCHHAPSLDEWGRQAQAIVLKGGNGPTGMVLAAWDGPTTNIW